MQHELQMREKNFQVKINNLFIKQLLLLTGNGWYSNVNFKKENLFSDAFNIAFCLFY